MSFPYSTRYYPPIPALEIAIRAPEGGPPVGPLLALVDTGADGTVVPAEHLDRLHLTPVDWARLRGPWDLVVQIGPILEIGPVWQGRLQIA